MANTKQATVEPEVESLHDADADPMVRNGAAERRAEEAQKEAQMAPDQCVPGGRYEVNGQIVDANGKPLKGESNADDAADATP
jgi:hypothetical protein